MPARFRGKARALVNRVAEALGKLPKSSAVPLAPAHCAHGLGSEFGVARLLLKDAPCGSKLRGRPREGHRVAPPARGDLGCAS